MNRLHDRIAAAKAKLGKDVVILGHHYQRDEVVKFADFRGDSLKLSQQAAEADAKFIVFCGVHFMAESADILRRGNQVVVLLDLSAGCSMADMADIGQVEACWSELGSVPRGQGEARRRHPTAHRRRHHQVRGLDALCVHPRRRLRGVVAEKLRSGANFRP